MFVIYGVWSDEINTTFTIHHRPVAKILLISPSPAQDTEVVAFSGEGTDDGNITQFVWTSDKDGELYRGPSPDFTSSSLSSGTHEITLVVYDDHNISSRIVSLSLTVVNSDSEPPVASVTSPENGTTVKGTINITGTASDNRAILYVEYRLKGSAVWSHAFGTEDWKAQVDTTQMDDGEHIVEIRSWDGQQYSSVSEITFTVRNKDAADDDEDDEDILKQDVAGMPILAIIGLLAVVIIVALMLLLRREPAEKKDAQQAVDPSLTTLPPPVQPPTSHTTLHPPVQPPTAHADPPVALAPPAGQTQTTSSFPVPPPVVPAQAPPRPSSQPFESIGYWSCPRCGNAVEGKFKFCTSCGFKRLQ